MMATVIDKRARPPSLAADPYEKVLAVGAVVLLAAVLAALARGHAQWDLVPAILWVHLATIIVALALTPVMLVQPRGTRRHRVLGRVWVVAMLATAIVSFAIRESDGSFSIIHILSVFTMVMAPMIWWSARHHRVAQHRRSVRGMVTGALLIAGFFTFPFGRLLGRWLFG